MSISLVIQPKVPSKKEKPKKKQKRVKQEKNQLGAFLNQKSNSMVKNYQDFFLYVNIIQRRIREKGFKDWEQSNQENSFWFFSFFCFRFLFCERRKRCVGTEKRNVFDSFVCLFSCFLSFLKPNECPMWRNSGPISFSTTFPITRTSTMPNTDQRTADTKTNRESNRWWCVYCMLDICDCATNL